MTNGPPSLGSPIVYKGKWLGGTGKFEGLSGEFEIRPTHVLISETLVQGLGEDRRLSHHETTCGAEIAARRKSLRHQYKFRRRLCHGLLPPPALGEGGHRCLARRQGRNSGLLD
jgi:hypothetical protein